MNLLKDYFLKKEADNWFERNSNIISKKKFYDDLYSKEIINFLNKNNSKSLKFLDIGAANGMRLKFISEKVSNKSIKYYGVEPSIKAIRSNIDNKIIIKKSTADRLPYDDETFDVVAFSFCLYLCDDYLLPKISYEALRVLKKNSYIFIFDFYKKKKIYKKYKHLPNLKIRKMDNSKIFTGFPFIEKKKEKIIPYNLFYNFQYENIYENDDKLAVHMLKKK
jgi:ubiquinone/menaquinone biosynthesis C-methylase UbiE